MPLRQGKPSRAQGWPLEQGLDVSLYRVCQLSLPEV